MGGNPPLPSDAESSRILPAVPISTSGAHAFRRIGPNGRPISFDPCRPIHYVVNPTDMPDGGLRVVQDAVARISAATGFAFTYDGFTDEQLSDDRATVQSRYGDRWAPVLIGWADQREVKALAGAAGVGFNRSVAPDGPDSERYVTGAVLLNKNYAANWSRQGEEVARGTVMQVLALVLGLDHVTDRRELMSPAIRDDTLGPGDKQALALLGAGPCWRDA
jgi:hypothetical protein